MRFFVKVGGEFYTLCGGCKHLDDTLGCIKRYENNFWLSGVKDRRIYVNRLCNAGVIDTHKHIRYGLMFILGRLAKDVKSVQNNKSRVKVGYLDDDQRSTFILE